MEIPGVYVDIKGDITQLKADMQKARTVVKDSASGIPSTSAQQVPFRTARRDLWQSSVQEVAEAVPVQTAPSPGQP